MIRVRFSEYRISHSPFRRYSSLSYEQPVITNKAIARKLEVRISNTKNTGFSVKMKSKKITPSRSNEQNHNVVLKVVKLKFKLRKQTRRCSRVSSKP